MGEEDEGSTRSGEFDKRNTSNMELEGNVTKEKMIDCQCRRIANNSSLKP